MSWLRLDDQYADHPKLLELAERDRWRWTTLLVHVARYRLDGHVTDNALRACRIGPKLRAQLLDVGLLDAHPDGALHVHDWRDYNTSKRDSTNRDRQRRYRERHGLTSRATMRQAPDVTPLRDALPVTPGPLRSPLPPSPQELKPPPDPPATAPAAPAAAARRAGGRTTDIGGEVADQLERLERERDRLQQLAPEPAAWGDEPAAWGDDGADQAPDGASDR